MIRATSVSPAGKWSEVATDMVVLDFENRCRRRIRMQGEGGLDFLLDLPEVILLKDGDGLVLEDGRIVEVKAEPEPLAEIMARDAGHLIRLAWHLGNRHLPVAIAGDALLIRRDHVIEEMLASLGAKVAHVEAPFDPEGGAYERDHHHGHDDHHGHG